MNRLCAAGQSFSGVGPCDGAFGVPWGVIFAGANVELTPADEANLLEKLQELAINQDFAADRIQPFGDIGNVTFSGEEPTMGTLAATGKTKMLRPGTAIYLFEYESGLCIDAALDRFNDYKGGIFLITREPAQRLYGFRNSKGNIVPMPVQSVAVFGGMFDDGQNFTTSKLRINLGSDRVLKRRAWFMSFAADADLESLVGLRTAVLTVPDTQYPTDVLVQDGCGYDSLFNEVGDEIIDPTNWKATNLADGVVNNPTNIVPSVNVPGAFTFTFGGGIGTYSLELAPPSELTEGLKGWASEPITVISNT